MKFYRTLIGLLLLIFTLNGVASQKYGFLGADTLRPSYDVNLEPIEVKGSKIGNTFRQPSRVVKILEREQIENLPAQSIEGLLEYIAPVDIRQRGTEGVQADVSIRGSSADQVLVLLNGINITDPQTGHHNLNLPVDFSQIERIEILEGSSARLYSPNAFAGAINIITKELPAGDLRVSLSAGNHRFLNTSAAGGIQTGKIGHTFSLNWKSSDGYTRNTDFEISNLFYSGTAPVKTGVFDLQAGYSEKGFGANSFYTPKYPDQYENTKVVFGSLNFRSTGKWHLNPVAYWRQHYDRFKLFRSDPPSWYKSDNFHQTRVYGGGISSWRASRNGRTMAGLHYRGEEILSNVLGEPLANPVAIPGENVFYSRSANRYISSAFAEHEHFLGNFTVSIALMSYNDRINNGKISWRVYPAIDLNYRAAKQIRLYASYSKSVRLPTFTDLYYADPTHKGNPALKPETSASVEGGIKINHRILNGTLGYFYRNGKNLIDWVREADSGVWETLNYARVASYGFEISLEFDPEELLGSDFFVTDFRINYLNSRQEKLQTEFISFYLLDYLRNKLNVSIRHRIMGKLFANWEVVYQDRNGTYTQFADNQYGSEKEYCPFWLLDGRVTYQLPHVSFYLNGSNLLNRPYFDFGNIRQPGRWLKAGIVADVNLK